MIQFPHSADRTAGILRYLGWSAAATILIAPAIGMQISDEVDWGAGDFVLMAVLLLIVGGTIELIARQLVAPRAVKWGLAGLAILAFLTIWGELAVGLID